jgi:beta-hydroxylase
MSDTKKFYDQKTTFPFLDRLSSKVDEIRKELEILRTWYSWPEKHLTPPNPQFQWHVIPLYGFGVWAQDVEKQFPDTFALLKQIPGLRTAIFSRLGPNSMIKPHYGWADLANTVLRCHLGLFVPENCGIWVEGEKQPQHQNEWLVFDDSKYHSGYNMGTQPRVVLLLDIDRPPEVPRGTSTWVETKERDEFISYFAPSNSSTKTE